MTENVFKIKFEYLEIFLMGYWPFLKIIFIARTTTKSERVRKVENSPV